MYKDNELIQEFLNYEKYNQLKSNNTVKNYELDLKLFEGYTGEQGEDILKVDKRFIEQYKTYLLNDIELKNGNNGYSPSTVARHMATLRSFYNYLAEEKYIEESPAERVQSPKIPERQPMYLTEKQAQKLVQATNSENEPYKSRDKLILVMFLSTGLRLSELANIRLSDITEDMLRVVGKGNKEREVALNNDVLYTMEEYLKVRPIVKTDYLFISERNRQMSNRAIQYRIEKYIDKSGLDTNKYTVHTLRHTAATIMHKNGTDIKTIQELLGHSKVETTAKIYTHVDREQLKQASNSVQGKFL